MWGLAEAVDLQASVAVAGLLEPVVPVHLHASDLESVVPVRLHASDLESVLPVRLQDANGQDSAVLVRLQIPDRTGPFVLRNLSLPALALWMT